MSTQSLRITEAFPAPPQPETLSPRFRDAFAELLFAAKDLAARPAESLYCDGCFGAACVRDSQLMFEHMPGCRVARLLAAIRGLETATPHVSSELLISCRFDAHSQCERSEEYALPGGPVWRRECSCVCHKEQP